MDGLSGTFTSPLAATGSTVEAIAVNSSYTAAGLEALSSGNGAITSSTTLNAGEATAFETQSAATSPPHGVWFPLNIDAGGTVLGAL